MKYAATDGHRLAISTSISKVLYALNKDIENEHVRDVQVVNDDYTHDNPNYPIIERIIPSSFAHELEISLAHSEHKKFLKACVCLDKKPTVRVSFKDDLVSCTVDQTTIRTPIQSFFSAAYRPEIADFGINARYLLDVLKLYSKYDVLVCKLQSTSISAITITASEADLHLIMPHKLAS
jgi:DNA polymerase III sliding clamp (beta) subunit (PCNA family)